MHPNPERIMDMSCAFYDAGVLLSAVELGIFQKLSELGDADSQTVADELELNPRGTRLLLDACAAVGLLEKSGETYRNAPDADTFLVPGRPGDLTGAIGYNRNVYDAWGALSRMVRTGRPVEKPQLHLGEDTARTRTFVMSMHARALAIGRGVLPVIDLKGCRRLLDIGGGPGTFSVLFARAYPSITCVVMDLPDIVAIAGELIAEQGMSGRVDTLAGDYHTTFFPAGNDAVHIFGVLHQESSETIQDILQRSYEALLPGGRIHILDMMTDASHTGPKFSALFAVNMALTTENGWVFSGEELRGWLKAAGFRDIRVMPLPPPMPHWLASARK